MSDRQARTEPTRCRPSVQSSSEIETMHDVLSDWERRAVLYYLEECDSDATVSKIATHLVAWARGRELATVADDEAVEHRRDRLRRRHLEQLDEFGVLDYAPRTERVRLAEDVKLALSDPWTDGPSSDDGAGGRDGTEP